MAQFAISVTAEVLRIKRNKFTAPRLISLVAIIFVFFIALLVIPFDRLDDKSAYINYIFPLGMLIALIIAGIGFFMRFEFSFDKSKDVLLKNDKWQCRLSDIDRVEWNVDGYSDEGGGYLELRTKDNQLHRLLRGEKNIDKENTNIGRAIAKFLKIEFANNNPWEKDILWGNYDVNESDIRNIQNEF